MTNSNLQSPTRILVAGEGGQGIQLLAKIIADNAYNHGYEISYIPHYGVEMRMGISFAYLQLSKIPIAYPKFAKADLLIVMGKRDLDIPQSFIDKNTRVINTIDLIDEPLKHNLPAKSYNMIVLGILVKELNTTEFRLDFNKIKEEIKKKLAHKKSLQENLQALEIGFAISPENYNQPLSRVKKQVFEPLIDKDKQKEFIRFPNLCKGCGLCLEKCPVRALSWDKKELNFISRAMPKVDLNKCTACQTCQHICPDSAIKVIKKK